MYELKNTKNVCGVADDSDEDDDFAEELGDKDADDSFMESYSDALNKELSSTTLEKSFAHAPRPETNNEVALVYFKMLYAFFLYYYL